jgi:hypothetical protein
MIVDLPLWLVLLPFLLAAFGVGLMTLLVIFLPGIIARLLCRAFPSFLGAMLAASRDHR